MTDSVPAQIDPHDAVVQGRNRRLGLLIAALVLAQVVTFIILFKNNGLPKDPTIWKEQQARAAQQATKDAHD
jgi:hypothetical protein